MTLRHSTPDERLTTYLCEQWFRLVADAGLLCADPRDAEGVALGTFARIAARWPSGRGFEDLDSLVPRRLVRACLAHDKARRGGEPGGIQLMDVATESQPGDGGSGELVRRAVAELPARQRAVLVLGYRGLAIAADPADPVPAPVDATQAAELIGCSTTIGRRELAKALARLEDLLGLDAIGAVTGDGSSRTEALLRRALSEAPPPVIVARDALPALAHQVSRVRRRRAVMVPAPVAVVVLAVILTLLNGSSPVVGPTTKAVAAMVPTPPRSLPRLLSANPSGVVTGAGFLWTVELHPSANGGGTTIERRDLLTGRPEQSYRVPGEDFGIAYGLGRIWTWGADDVRPLVNEVSTIDPATARIQTVELGDGSIDAVAFTSGRAWFTQPQRNRVVLLAARIRSGRVAFPADGARGIGALTTHSVAILGSAGGVLELPLGVVINRNDPSLTLLSSTPSYGVWIGHGDTLTYQPTINSPLSVRLRLPLEIAHVVGDPTTGVYVATESQDPLHVSPYLVYYSPLALQAAHPRPSARLDGSVAVQSMTVGVDGALVYVTTDGSVVSWNPSQPG